MRVYLKTALRRHVQSGGTDWDSPVVESNLELFHSALKCFFMICHLGLPKSHFYLSPLAGYYLICACDGSPDLSSISISLVSFLNFQEYKARAMHLYLDCSVRHIQSSHQVHLAELIALLKCCVKAVETLQDLSQLDIKIPPENVILLSDSRYCLLTSSQFLLFSIKNLGP